MVERFSSEKELDLLFDDDLICLMVVAPTKSALKVLINPQRACARGLQ